VIIVLVIPKVVYCIYSNCLTFSEKLIGADAPPDILYIAGKLTIWEK
jgi:hypothetical protein